MGVARDVEAARLEGREERLVVEVVRVRQPGRAGVAVEDDVVDVGQVLRVRGRKLELGEVVARRVDRAEGHHRAGNAPGIEEQGDGGDQVERAGGGWRPAGRAPGDEQADADQQRPGTDERPLVVQELRRRIPRVAVAEESCHQDGGQQCGPMPVPQCEGEQRQHDRSTAHGNGEWSPQWVERHLVRRVGGEQEDHRIRGEQQGMDRQRGQLHAAHGVSGANSTPARPEARRWHSLSGRVNICSNTN